ncbi:MAG: multiple sugar transport system substrate-binding protein [Clostridiales bacterium]|nr:multiple sugar transport system substrate-binding protein [Clostridiales bacterium]
MKKKWLAILLGATIATSLLAGYQKSSSDNTTSTTQESTADTKTKLVIAFNDSGDTGKDGYMYNWIMNTYNNWEKKDQVEIELQTIIANDSDYFTKLQTEMQDESTSPDVFFEDMFQLNTDVAAGYVADITAATEGWDDWNTAIIESLKEGTKGADEKTYAVPVSTDVRGLWYNKDVFEQAGLGRDWQPESWQDILDACAAIKSKCGEDVVPFWFACSNTEAEATSMNTFEMLLYGTGETLVDESTGV